MANVDRFTAGYSELRPMMSVPRRECKFSYIFGEEQAILYVEAQSRLAAPAVH